MEVLVGGQHSNFVSGFEEVLKTPSSLGNKAAAAAKSSIERRSLRETEGRQKEDSFADKEAAAAMRHCSTTKKINIFQAGCVKIHYIYITEVRTFQFYLGTIFSHIMVGDFNPSEKY